MPGGYYYSCVTSEMTVPCPPSQSQDVPEQEFKPNMRCPKVALSPEQAAFPAAIPSALRADARVSFCCSWCLHASSILGWRLPAFTGRWVRNGLIHLWHLCPPSHLPPMTVAAPKYHMVGTHRMFVEMSFAKELVLWGRICWQSWALLSGGPFCCIILSLFAGAAWAIFSWSVF